MTDVALSILALIAGGLTMELFRTAWTPARHPEIPAFPLEVTEGDWQTGNPS